jgi:hypothetical protein
MKERKFYWYHNLMVSFSLQMTVCFVCFIIIAMQIFAYDTMENTIVSFNGACEVQIGPTVTIDDVESTYPGAQMKCGGESVKMGTVEKQFLFYALTTGTPPVIMCTKNVTEYLKEVTWKCGLKNEKEFK